MCMLSIDILVQKWSGYVMTRKTRLSKSKLSWSTLRCVHKIMKAQIMSLTPVSTRGCQFTNEWNADKRREKHSSWPYGLLVWFVCESSRDRNLLGVICYLYLYDILAGLSLWLWKILRTLRTNKVSSLDIFALRGRKASSHFFLFVLFSEYSSCFCLKLLVHCIKDAEYLWYNVKWL